MTMSSTPWWDPELKTEPHTRLLPLVKAMQETQAQRYENMRRMVSVYEYGGGSGANTPDDLSAIDDARLHFNVAKNAMDTMHAQVCTPRVAPMLLTEGGTKGQRDRAKMATKAIEGVFDENDFEEIREDVVLDAQVSYCGFALVYSCVYGKKTADNDTRYADIKIERILPEDIFVDEAEGLYRKPRCIYRRQFRDRYVLLAEYGKPDADLFGSAATRKSAIKKAKAGSPRGNNRVQNADQIEVWEAWHLPSGPVEYEEVEEEGKRRRKPAHDGLHAICIDGCTLFSEPWDCDRFPIAVYRPEKARTGFWGLAAMRQAMAGQREYERVTERLQRAHKKQGSAGFVVSRGANLNTRELTNGVGWIVEVDGSPDGVRDVTPTPANPQTYEYREGIASDVLRFLGLSGFSAQSEVPAGMTNASGKALQTFEDSEGKRGILRHRGMERFVIDASDLVITEARRRIAEGIRIESRYRDKTGFQCIDWNEIIEVLEDRKSYVVRTFPVGMLAQTPSAKFAQLDSLLDRGVINVEQFKRLFEIPDLEAENAIDTADVEIIDKNLDYMVTTGKYLSPQSFDSLELIIERGGKVYNAYRIAEVLDERLELVRRYIIDAKALIDEAASKAAAMASGPPGMPMREGMGPEMPPPPMGPEMGAPMGGPPMIPPGMAA